MLLLFLKCKKRVLLMLRDKWLALNQEFISERVLCSKVLSSTWLELVMIVLVSSAYAAQAEETGGFDNKNACISSLSSSANCRKSQEVTAQIHYLTEIYLHTCAAIYNSNLIQMLNTLCLETWSVSWVYFLNTFSITGQSIFYVLSKFL